MNAPIDETQRAFLREYYGRTLATKHDLTEQVCCTDATTSRHADTIRLLPDEVVARHYGCGCPIPEDDLRGLVCLDLGSGAGVDAFILSRLVGPEGHVHGIDMTDEQLETARAAAPVVAERFGFAEPNTTFHKDFIETADAIADASIDLIISDCVINLSPRKDLVLDTMWRVLKDGGELYISDIVSDRRLPEHIRNDARLHAECIGGALYEHDWYDLMKAHGFKDPRVVERKVLQTEVESGGRTEPIVFSTVTVRAQKFGEPLDNRCEDYGQTATYLGGFERCPARFLYDDHHAFELDRPVPVCRNTARMLKETRLGKGFRVSEPIKHFGLFDCGPSASTAVGMITGIDPVTGAACC